MIAPRPLYTPDGDAQSVLYALRELLSQHPEAMSSGAEVLAELLFERRYLARPPYVFEVEAALEVLRDDDGEVLG
jgi:hypothetical protein